jgi:hypothetical protein
MTTAKRASTLWRAAAAAALGALLASCTGPSPQAPTDPRVAAFAKLPDWSGLWEPNVFVGEGIGQSLSAAGARSAQPLITAKWPFTAEWQAKLDEAKKALQAAAAADPNHPAAPGYNNCGSPPYIVNLASPAIYEWRITPEETTLVDTIGGIRHIYTDGRSHPPADELWPTKIGDSVGRWEGDTLVVDTVAIKPDIITAFAPEAGGFIPLRMSDQMHFMERMRLVSRDELQDEFTLEDPVALTEPFKVTFSFARVKDATRMIDETECDSTTDRNPIVNGRFTSITTR